MVYLGGMVCLAVMARESGNRTTPSRMESEQIQLDVCSLGAFVTEIKYKSMGSRRQIF
jgi:hypothetical protein